MTILRRIERRWAEWALGGIREHYARAEAGLRLRLHEAEQTNIALERANVQLLNSHMDLSMDLDKSEVLVKRLRRHADRLANQCIGDCDHISNCDGCSDCAWQDSCHVTDYFTDEDVHDYR